MLQAHSALASLAAPQQAKESNSLQCKLCNYKAESTSAVVDHVLQVHYMREKEVYRL